MYYKNEQGKAEREDEVDALWAQLHNYNVYFYEHINELGKKALMCESRDSFKILMQTYLMMMNRLDAKLFLGTVYWTPTPKQIERVFDLLIKEKYADRIVTLAVGVGKLCALYPREAGRETQNQANIYATIMKLASDNYKRSSVDLKEKWKFVCSSMRLFAQLYDLVQEEIEVNRRRQGYFDFLESSKGLGCFSVRYKEYIEEVFEPRRLIIMRFLLFFMPKKRNRRKHIRNCLWLKEEKE